MECFALRTTSLRIGYVGGLDIMKVKDMNGADRELLVKYVAATLRYEVLGWGWFKHKY